MLKAWRTEIQWNQGKDRKHTGTRISGGEVRGKPRQKPPFGIPGKRGAGIETNNLDEGEGVTLMTLHGAKALEFKWCSLPGWRTSVPVPER